MCQDACVKARVQLGELVISSYHVGSGIKLRLSSRYLCPLKHRTSPLYFFNNKIYRNNRMKSAQ